MAFNVLSVTLLCIEAMVPFFRSQGDTPVSKQSWNISAKGLLMQSSRSFSIRILILSCPLILFGSSNLIILQIATAVKLRKLIQEGNKL